MSTSNGAGGATDTSAQDRGHDQGGAQDRQQQDRDAHRDTGRSAHDDTGHDDGGDEGGEDGGRQPLSAEELNKRYTALKRDLKSYKRSDREKTERLERLERQVRTRAEDEGLDDIEIPDIDTDPEGAVKAMAKIISRFRDERKQQYEEGSKRQGEERFITDLKSYMGEAEADFREINPDYGEALKAFKAGLREQLEDDGYDGAELRREMDKRLLQLVHRAKQSGADPAERVYNLAVKRYGYTSKKAEKDLDDDGKRRENERPVRNGGGRSNGFSMKGLIDAKPGADFDKEWAKYEERARRSRN